MFTTTESLIRKFAPTSSQVTWGLIVGILGVLGLSISGVASANSNFVFEAIILSAFFVLEGAARFKEDMELLEHKPPYLRGAKSGGDFVILCLCLLAIFNVFFATEGQISGRTLWPMLGVESLATAAMILVWRTRVRYLASISWQLEPTPQNGGFIAGVVIAMALVAGATLYLLGAIPKTVFWTNVAWAMPMGILIHRSVMWMEQVRCVRQPDRYQPVLLATQGDTLSILLMLACGIDAYVYVAGYVPKWAGFVFGIAGAALSGTIFLFIAQKRYLERNRPPPVMVVTIEVEYRAR